MTTNAPSASAADAQAALALFERWLDLDAAARAELVDATAHSQPTVHRRLIAYIRADSSAKSSSFLLEHALLDVSLDAAADDEPDASGQRIGAWRLERTLGTGGMGRVWLARRSDGQHEGFAAIKMLRVAIADAHANRRFALEGKLLARLAHPHIAMLLDAGFGEDGQRYLVLEYVDGERIDLWCDARRLGVAARLRLMLQICAAISHAHANLVVHRDLKPSNILVQADGTAKLLDFGVAKLLDDDAGTKTQLTHEIGAALTPGFAAPEQLLGDAITTATDVYSLGVTMYLLLAGRSPYDTTTSSPAQLARAVIESSPRRLSDFSTHADANLIAAARDSTPDRLREALRGDLDTIVARALKKNPAERYASVEALADDIRRHLDHRPIAARADSTLYRMRKFARRNWLPLAAAAVLFGVVAVSAAMITAQARATEREARATVAVKDFLFGIFNSVDPFEAKGKEVSARELLDRGAEQIDANAGGDPALRAELQSVLGRIYARLGLHAQAAELEKHALEASTTRGETSLSMLQTQIDYATTLRELGDFKQSEALAGDAVRRLDAMPSGADGERIYASIALADTEVSKRDFAAAKTSADRAVALARESSAPAYDMARSLWVLANAEWGLKSLDAAQAHYRDALREMTRAKGPDSARVGKLHGSLAMVMRSRSEFENALVEGEQSLEIVEKSLGPGHPDAIAVRASLGLTQYHLGQYAHARDSLQTAADAQQRADNPARAGTLINLGLVQIEIPDLDAAEKSFAESLATWEKKYGRSFAGAQNALSGLGRVHALQGRYDAAAAEIGEVLASDTKLGIEDDYASLYWFGELQRQRHNFAEAVTFDRDALRRAQHDLGEKSRYTAFAHEYLGLALRDAGDAGAAENELRAALDSFGYIAGAQHPWAATVRLEIAALIATRSAARAEREKLLGEAVAIRERFFGADDARTREARAALTALAAR